MVSLYTPLTVALVLLTYTLTHHWCHGAPTVDPAGPGGGVHDFRRMDIIKHTEESRLWFSTVTTAPNRVSAVPRRVVRTTKPDRDQTTAVTFHNDLRKKEKFLKHIAGPLHFSPKCRKHVYRLYHQTRDCTIPAYFKRCARLLTRLAGSPQCT